MELFFQVASLFLQAWLCFLTALLLILLFLGATPDVEITPPEPHVEIAQPVPIRQRRGARRQLHY